MTPKHKRELLKLRLENLVNGNRALNQTKEEKEARLEAGRRKTHQRWLEASHNVLPIRIDQLFAGDINVNRSIPHGCD
jgi:hypothetical protein